jgi:NADH-quinone oxidoreductase subunit L
MMFALGVSDYGGESGLGYSASMFHLFTHAFFKSLLFLGAGAVIHVVHSNDMSDMGGLRKAMPIEPRMASSTDSPACTLILFRAIRASVRM